MGNHAEEDYFGLLFLKKIAIKPSRIFMQFFLFLNATKRQIILQYGIVKKKYCSINYTKISNHVCCRIIH